ncbi:hypothetical protein DIPPA_09127 [Diplonema papillatum]|nr:hypothetical protein DIPPA_09127 [Diplonema papillatum]
MGCGAGKAGGPKECDVERRDKRPEEEARRADAEAASKKPADAVGGADGVANDNTRGEDREDDEPEDAEATVTDSGCPESPSHPDIAPPDRANQVPTTRSDEEPPPCPSLTAGETAKLAKWVQEVESCRDQWVALDTSIEAAHDPNEVKKEEVPPRPTDIGVVSNTTAATGTEQQDDSTSQSSKQKRAE